MNKIDWKRIGYHLLFWIVLILTYDTLHSLLWDVKLSSYLLLDLYYTPTDILAVYVTLYFLFPKFLYQRKYFLFAFLFILFLLVITIGIAMPMHYIGVETIFPGKYTHGNTLSLYEFMKANFLIVITVKLMIVGIASVIKLLSKWVQLQKKQQLLEKEKLEIALKLTESELKFLKSQINPHFLFNALNNLYGLTLEKSDVAPDTVLKISALLDYMLHDCNVEFIDLKKEIQSLENYIDLQKIRYDESAKVTFNVIGNSENKVIAPLLLLPFVENAFKHGLTKNLGKGKVEINIFIETNSLIFTVENDFLVIEETKGHHGIGLKNVKKRLELQYKGNHELTITKKDNFFSVKLVLLNQDKILLTS